MSGRGRTSTVLGKAQRAKVIRKIIVRQTKAAAAIRGCVENAGGVDSSRTSCPGALNLTTVGLRGWTTLTLCRLLVVPLPPPPFSALGECIPTQSSRSVEPSFKRIWPTSLTNGLIFEGSMGCLLVE